jgi:hypothetical protein
VPCPGGENHKSGGSHSEDIIDRVLFFHCKENTVLGTSWSGFFTAGPGMEVFASGTSYSCYLELYFLLGAHKKNTLKMISVPAVCLASLGHIHWLVAFFPLVLLLLIWKTIIKTYVTLWLCEFLTLNNAFRFLRCKLIVRERKSFVSLSLISNSYHQLKS